MNDLPDSGKRQEFETGARRDIQDDKPDYVAIPLRQLDMLQYQYTGKGQAKPQSNKIDLNWIMLPEKPEFNYIPEYCLDRVNRHFEMGAKKYGMDNWKRGINLVRYVSSLMRHLVLWRLGDTQEDHLAAVCWNALAIMHTEHEAMKRSLPRNLADTGLLNPEEL